MAVIPAVKEAGLQANRQAPTMGYEDKKVLELKGKNQRTFSEGVEVFSHSKTS